MFIGPKLVKTWERTEEKTNGGVDIIRVDFEDGTTENFSDLMFSEITSEEACDLSVLRDKRLQPVVKVVLAIMRDWGIKLGELPYFSSVLNQSLDYNGKEAMNELLSHWMPRPLSPDDVDLVTIDRILKSRKTLKDVIGE